MLGTSAFHQWVPKPSPHSLPAPSIKSAVTATVEHVLVSVHGHTHPLVSSSALHAGYWTIFLAQTPELRVTASPDKVTKTL